MKKQIILILIFTMLLYFAGCSKVKEDDHSDTPAASNSYVDGSLSEPEESKVKNVSDKHEQTKQDNKTKIVSNNSQQPEKADKAASGPARPEKVTKIYNTQLDFEVATPIKETFHDSQNGNVLPYALYIPKDYSASKKYPVLLFLHGAGEIGNDNQLQLNGIRNLLYYNADFVSQTILICPQTAEWWNLDREYEGDQKGTLGSVLHLLQKIQNTYSCDENRIYVTGLSMGGYATWDILEHYGNLFAAGIPLCGGGNSGNGRAFVDIPIRIYHGTEDRTVSPVQSKNMYRSIMAAGGNKVELYLLDGYGHDVWSYAYGNRDLFSWLFAQDKVHNPSGKYDYISYFRIVDFNGKTVITDEDIVYADYINNLDHNDTVDIDIHLTEDGINRLNKAYTASNGKEFTVYCSTQKVYSFTAAKSISDDFFSVVGVFNGDNYLTFLNIIQNVPS